MLSVQVQVSLIMLLAIHATTTAPATTTNGACRRRPFIFNFGDSNSDTGGASVLLGRRLEFPEGRVFFGEPTGRLCDGRLLIDFLCESLGTKYLTSYHELFAPDFSNGVNFALSGSDTLRSDPFLPYRLFSQISNFDRFYNISVHRRLISAKQFESALYMFDIGQNDLDGNYGRLPFDNVLALIPTIISNIGRAMQVIYEHGGRNFWVHNTGVLGCLPYNVAGRNASMPIDQYGCISQRNEAAAEFNARLARLCATLNSEMEGATIVYVDVHAIKLDLFLNYTSYGLEHPFKVCRNVMVEEGRRCASWDGVHYSEAANELVAGKILSTNFSTPPLPFNFFCN